MINPKIQEIINEVKANYPDYTDEHVNDYVQWMKDEGYSKKDIEDFIIAMGY